MLRPQQETLRLLVDEIKNGSPIKDIILAWSVGAGKSLASVILSDLLTEGKKQLVIVPRKSLQVQGEITFSGDFYPTSKTARIASNSGDPWRGCDSAFITFQAVCRNPIFWIEIFQKYNVMLIMDEAHHLSGHGDWIKTIERLKELSLLTVFMSGSTFRGDDTRIPFLPYNENGDLNYTNTDNLKWIVYTSKEALRDGHILPFEVTTIDGSGSYIDLDGLTRNFDKLGSCGDHLRCVFDSDYAFSFIDFAFNKWIKHRVENKYSKMIIVSANIKIANKYTEYIKKKYPNIRSGIATSEDSKLGAKIIKRSKMDNSNSMAIDCLISVNTAYEGLDIPQCDYMIVLTLIRSLQWVLQCVGRCQRTYSGKTKGYIFAPADLKMIKLLEMIDAGSVNSACIENEQQDKKKPSDDEEEKREARTIQALSSKAHIKEFPDFNPAPIIEEVETISEKEKRIRSEINKISNRVFVKAGAGNRKVKERVFWLKVKQVVNNGKDEDGKTIRKPLKDMSIKELDKVLEYIKHIYS